MLTIRALLDDRGLGIEVVTVDHDRDLEREVLWLHTTELPDPSPYLRPGELVLTNGLWRSGVPDEHYVSSLARNGAGGLLFGLTTETPIVPAALVEAARAVSLPLLTVPIDVPFAAVTHRAAAVQSQARQAALVGSLRRGDELAAVIQRGQGAAGVLELLSRHHDLTLAVVDRRGIQLAGAELPVGTRREFANALTRRPPPLEVSTDGGPATLFLIEGATGRIDAGLLCIKANADVAAGEREALEQAARFLSLEVAKLQAVQAIEMRFSGELLEIILSGPARFAELTTRLRSFGIDAGEPLAVVAITRPGNEPLGGALGEIERVFSAASMPAVIAAGSTDTVLLFGWRDGAAALQGWAQGLAGTLSTAAGGEHVTIGVGEIVRDLSELRDELLRAREAAQVLAKRSGGVAVSTFAGIGSHLMLLGLHDKAVLRRLVDDGLGPLRAHDERSNGELEQTLRVFLENDGHWAATAQQLFIHVNTLRNRIQRVSELTGRDMARFEDRVEMFLALKADTLR